MSLMDLFGSKDAKRRGQFAQAVAAELQAQGLARATQYDDVNFALLVGELRPPVVIFLNKAFRERKIEDYARLSPDERRLFVARFTTAEKKSLDVTIEARTAPRNAQAIKGSLELATKTARLLDELRRTQAIVPDSQPLPERAAEVTPPPAGLDGLVEPTPLPQPEQRDNWRD